MAGRDPWWFPALQPAASSYKEQIARKVLRNIRMQGHTYVDLRMNGKRYFFFCILCLAPCYSEPILFDHLRGKLHKGRYAAAQATLLGPNPWPFDDGMLFFDQSDEKKLGNKNASVTSGIDLPESHGDENSQDITIHASASASSRIDKGSAASKDDCEGEYGGDKGYDMVIPGVLGKDVICKLGVKLMGYGSISARLLEKDEAEAAIKSIWCEWLGKTDEDNSKTLSVAYDFAIVSFKYRYDLGKESLVEDIKSFLMSNVDNEDPGTRVKRLKKCVSDPEDVSESLRSQWDSAGEESSSSVIPRSLLDQYDDHRDSRKTFRRELRKQQHIAAQRSCTICEHMMLPGKDVAALLNMKAGKLVCSRRNVNGAFHVFHISCLIRWILICEAEMFENKPVEPNPSQKSTPRTGSKSNTSGKQHLEQKVCSKRSSTMKQDDEKASHQQIRSVFCPQCQGTGKKGGGSELENPTYHISEVFWREMKLSDAHKSWMKHPEKLQNCSTGLDFELQDDKAEEKVSFMKMLRFYRADEDSWIASSS